MEIKIGSVVRSIAGHDKGDLLLVIAMSDGFAYVADGKLRKVLKPKKKKLKHLQGTHFVTEEDFSEDYKVRNILAEYLKRV